jgi:hypothetical protein
MTLGEILEHAKSLSLSERKELVKILVDTLDTPTSEPQHSILEFEGIAAHLADEEDPQAYINRIRSEWDKHP